MPKTRCDDSAFYRVDRPLVLAHRGASDIAPENTLAAFQAAQAAGADGIELDVTGCCSGEIVVLHDDTVDRTTNGSGRVDTMSLDTLRELDAGAWFHPEYTGQRIPTLPEVLDLMTQWPAGRLNIELKSRTWRDNASLVAQVVELVRSRNLGQRVIFSSFNPLTLWHAARLAPAIQRGLLYAPDLPIYLARAWTRPLIHPTALHPRYTMVDERYRRWSRARGYRVNVWTVDQPEAMRQMVALGVDAIITNHPAAVLASMNQQQV